MIYHSKHSEKAENKSVDADCIVFSDDNLTASEHCQVPSSRKQIICFYSVKKSLFLHSCNRKHETSVFFKAHSRKISQQRESLSLTYSACVDFSIFIVIQTHMMVSFILFETFSLKQAFVFLT